MRHSLLQTKILGYLAEHPAKNVTEIAKGINSLRPSVSRSLGLLESKGMVKNSQGWQVTDAGLREVLSRFRLADDLIWKWGDWLSSYDCPCGEEIILSSEDSLEECQCGRTYRFLSAIEVKGYSNG